jgi:hypothetical protein
MGPRCKGKKARFWDVWVGLSGQVWQLIAVAKRCRQKTKEPVYRLSDPIFERGENPK